MLLVLTWVGWEVWVLGTLIPFGISSSVEHMVLVVVIYLSMLDTGEVPTTVSRTVIPNRFGELYIHWSAECHKGFRAIEGTSSHLGVVFITVLGLESTTKLMTIPLFPILGSLFGHALGVMAWGQI